MRYRQELVNCVSECLRREISSALIIGNSLGLTSFAFPTKPGKRSLWLTRRNLLWQRRQMLSDDFCWCFVLPQSRARKAVELEAAHIPNRGVAPTVPLLCRFPVPLTEVNLGYESGSSGSTRSPKASKKIGRGSAPGAGATLQYVQAVR